MSDEPALLTIDEAGVRTVILNRPTSFNSLTTALKEQLLAALRLAAADDAVRAVVVTGAGEAFCAGQDLKEYAGMLDSGDPTPATTVERHYNPIVQTIVDMPKPVVAAVRGIAAGAGAGLAYACDLRIAGTSTRFLMAFAGAGLGPDSGTSWTLPRLVGYGRAMQMLLLAAPVTAQRALELGMVAEVVPDDDVLTAGQRVAARLAAGPTTAYAMIKRAMLDAAGETLPGALRGEARGQAVAAGTADHLEAVAAFVAKRPPTFVGH